MTDELHILTQNRKMKPLAIALSGGGGVKGRDGGGELTDVQCEPIRNCHNESPLYNEYILIQSL
jgi:hypothetical protein